MFITRECDYAVRIVRALSDRDRLSVGEICEAENIPQPYAYKILKKLERGGIVQGFRGAHGGYVLEKALDKLTLYDIFSTIEDQFYFNECLQDGYECSNNTASTHCMVHKELGRLQGILIENMRDRSMAEILEAK